MEFKKSDTALVVIDPQNDFCDIANAALPVTGAVDDLARLEHLLRTAN